MPEGAYEALEDLSETKITILIQFARDVWNTIKNSISDTSKAEPLKQELLRLICYNYIKFNEPYDNGCSERWSKHSILDMLGELDTYRKSHSNNSGMSDDILKINIKSLSQKYGRDENIFD
jgi:hypothetical protein